MLKELDDDRRGEDEERGAEYTQVANGQREEKPVDELRAHLKTSQDLHDVFKR